MSVFLQLRRRVLTPDPSATRVDVRGFHEKNGASRDLVETIGETFLAGYSFAAEARSPAAAESRLQKVEPSFRGFAYEGAAMAFTVLDAARFGGPRRLETFLAGRGGDHAYMVHIGTGWALARLPRFLWRRVFPSDRLLRWLALDGYGFHQAFFRTRQYVHDRYQNPDVPWPDTGHRWYANRAIDQGIGRAVWFVAGTDVGLTAALIGKFEPHRRGDLWGGAGLAATYAGGADEAELRELWHLAGEHRPQVAQGCAFAAATRVLTGLVTPHTGLATEVLCGMTPQRAAELADEARPERADDGTTPGYEVWRQRITGQFVSLGRC